MLDDNYLVSISDGAQAMGYDNYGLVAGSHEFV